MKDEENFAYRYAESYEDIARYKNMEMVNWQDKMMGNTAITQTHNINITGGNNKTKFNVNYLYNKNEGIVAYTGLTKHQFTSKISHTLNKWLDSELMSVTIIKQLTVLECPIRVLLL